MKRCPTCRRDYYDDSLLYCLDDGCALLEGPASVDDSVTAILQDASSPSEAATRAQVHQADKRIASPHGPEGPDGKAASRRNSLIAGAMGILLVTALGFGGYFYWGRASVKQIESIAVMPFVNESGSSDIEYLSDGMTETLIGSLSRVPNLNVKARSTVFRYKGQPADAKTIGKELGVQTILLGHVVQRGERLTISLELVDAATEYVMWSQRYDRSQSDLVTLQSEIAKDVSRSLKLKLSGTDVAKVEKSYTADPEAYQLYLKGRFYWNKRTAESLNQAVVFFNQAIEKDPSYALAFAGLAEAYVLFPTFSVALPRDSMPKAKAAAVRAIEIDDSLAEAHAALGLYFSVYSWNQNAAEREFRRAIELDPNYPNSHQQFGSYCLNAMGKFDEAIAEAKRAEELDPLSPVISADVGWALFSARRYDEAIIQLERALALDPNFFLTRRYLATVYDAKGLYKEAAEEGRKALEQYDDPYTKAKLVSSLAKMGQRSEAVKILRELEAESAKRYVPSGGLALAYEALGEKDKAFDLLEKEVTERSARPTMYAFNPVWDDLRGHPRFAQIVRRVELEKMD
jgi:TolB-like protein/Tfp pilus assembly protein PilF